MRVVTRKARGAIGMADEAVKALCHEMRAASIARRVSQMKGHGTTMCSVPNCDPLKVAEDRWATSVAHLPSGRFAGMGSGGVRGIDHHPGYVILMP